MMKSFVVQKPHGQEAPNELECSSWGHWLRKVSGNRKTTKSFVVQKRHEQVGTKQAFRCLDYRNLGKKFCIFYWYFRENWYVLVFSKSPLAALKRAYCEFCFRIALSSDSVRPSSQLWHPSFSPLYDVFNLTTHVFSESLWHVLFTDAPVMTMKKTHANTKTKTKTMTKTKWLKDLACAIFFKMIWLKDIKSDDESVMHH